MSSWKWVRSITRGSSQQNLGFWAHICCCRVLSDPVQLHHHIRGGLSTGPSAGPHQQRHRDTLGRH